MLEKNKRVCIVLVMWESGERKIPEGLGEGGLVSPPLWQRGRDKRRRRDVSSMAWHPESGWWRGSGQSSWRQEGMWEQRRSSERSLWASTPRLLCEHTGAQGWFGGKWLEGCVVLSPAAMSTPVRHKTCRFRTTHEGSEGSLLGCFCYW